MESGNTRSKRRRLISVSSYVSPRRRPDLPAIFESLNDDTLTTVLEFVGDKCYRSFGGVNKRCKEVYITNGMTKETFVYGYAPLSVIRDRYDDSYSAQDALSKGVVFYNRKDILEWTLQERNSDVLRKISVVAVEEERFDILNDVLNNMNDYEKKAIFRDVDGYAVLYGKLDVLKWFAKKGLSIMIESCGYKAARHGHLHIMKWLQEEKDLKLNRGFYYDAAEGGHLNVMKWLREKEVTFHEWTFVTAAEEGNLDVLQWLHDEGCPWPEDDGDYLVSEEDLKSEVLDWLRVNGYRNRIIFRND